MTEGTAGEAVPSTCVLLLAPAASAGPCATSAAHAWSLNRVVGGHLKQTRVWIEAPDIQQAVCRASGPRVAVIGHHEDLKLRRRPFLRHDLDRLLVAEDAPADRGRPSHPRGDDAFDQPIRQGFRGLLVTTAAAAGPPTGAYSGRRRWWWRRRRRRRGCRPLAAGCRAPDSSGPYVRSHCVEVVDKPVEREGRGRRFACRTVLWIERVRGSGHRVRDGNGRSVVFCTIRLPSASV